MLNHFFAWPGFRPSWAGGALALILLAGAPLAQASPVPLNLKQALQLALQHNPELAAARAELDSMEGQIVQSATRPNPELAYALEDVRAAKRSHSLQLNLPLEGGNKREARISLARHSQALAAAAFNIRRQELQATVQAAFYETLAAQEKAALAGEMNDLAAKALQAVARSVAAGKVSPLEEVKAKLAQATVKLEASQAEADLHSARLRLATLLGQHDLGRELGQVQGELERLPDLGQITPNQISDSASAPSRLAAQAPQVQRAQAQLARQQAQLELERSRRHQDWTLSMGLKKGQDEGNGKAQVLLGLAVPLPWFDKNQGNLQSAGKQLEQAQHELQASQMQTLSAIRQEYAQLQTLYAQALGMQQEILPAAKRALEAAGIGFQHGKFSFLEMLDAQRTYFSARSQYLHMLSAAQRSAANLQRYQTPTSSAQGTEPTP